MLFLERLVNDILGMTWCITPKKVYSITSFYTSVVKCLINNSSADCTHIRKPAVSVEY